MRRSVYFYVILILLFPHPLLRWSVPLKGHVLRPEADAAALVNGLVTISFHLSNIQTGSANYCSICSAIVSFERASESLQRAPKFKRVPWFALVKLRLSRRLNHTIVF
jgi:hypothetical protein